MELLNGAKLSTDAAAKSTHLKQLAELVIRKDPSLLGEFLEPLLELQVDPAVAVRKTLVSLCEEIATGNPQHLARCIATLRALLKDAAPAVVKQAAKASGPVFREALIEAATKGEGPRVPKEVTDMWTAAKALKDDVRRLVLADRVNDGVRMQAVKFLELAVVLFHGREWGAGIVRDGHATVSLDALATEADDLMGVLLECLKPETCAAQAGTVTLVMIGAATSVMGKLPIYTDFALPALLELAAANVAGDAGDAKSAATASMAKELRSTLLNALKSSGERNEIAEYKSELVTALQELGATEEVETWRRQEERAAQKRKEREERAEQERVKRQRVGAGGTGRGFELAPDEIEIETATPPDLMRQVLSTIGTLAENDRAMLRAFVTQLAPDVLADVVLSQLANTDSVNRRTMIDVEAGAGRGVETFVLDAMAAHERGDHGATRAPRALTDKERLMMGAGDSDGDLAHLVADDEGDVEMEAAQLAAEEADRGRSGSKKGSKGKKGSKAADLGETKCAALTAEQVRHHGKGALTRIVQAADPGGPVARMGGLRLQNVLLTRLASAAVAAAASGEGPDAASAVGGAALRHGTGGGLLAETASSAALIAGAQTPSAGILEYLVSALPDRGAAFAATRLLGAIFVNQTLGLMGTISDGGEKEAESSSAKDKASKTSIHRVGPYARTLMTLAVGLIDSQTPARREHFTRLLLDAPAIPPPAIALLRATCALPPQGPARKEIKREGDDDMDVDADVYADVDAWGFGASADGETFSWAGTPLPKSPESLSVALETVRCLIERRPVVRAQCLEIALECAVSPNEDVRTRAVRLVSQRLHGVKTLATGIEAFALHHLDEASAEGKRALEEATRLAEKASESLARAKEKKLKAEKERAIKAAKLKAEAEGRAYKPGDEDGPAGPASSSVTEEDARKKEEAAAAEEEAAARERMTSVAVGDAVRATARHVALFCALCNRNNSLLPRLFDFYAKLPEILRPAVVEGVAFDSLVRHVGPACDALVAAIAQPPRGAETLVRRAVEVLADTSEYSEAQAQALAAAALEAGEEAKPPPPKQAPAALIAAVEKLAAANGDDVTYLVPLLGSFDAKRVKALMPRLVGSAPEIFSAALDRLTASIPPKPLTAPEIIVALHDVDPARDGVPLKRIIDACGACFERPDVFPAEALAAALQKMVEFTPLPLLFMRTVIQAETAAPTLREFTLGLLRTLARRQVWRMDPKIWEGFARCAKRSAPRSFPLLCELPPSALGEMLGKFPAMRQPLLAYASAPAVQSGISRAIMAVLQEDKQQQG